MKMIDAIQRCLNFEGTGEHNVRFRESGGGMMGTTGYLIGLCGGLHFGFVFTVLILYSLGVIWREIPPFLIALLHWSIYVGLLSTFHFLEFFSTAMWQPKTLCYDSFVVNHSRNYTLAIIASFVEYWTQQYFFPSYKHNLVIISIGLTVVILGQFIRTVAMWTCGRHFSHQIMMQRTEEHQLVTQGIYSVLRHPSYFGWFYWSVGTQLLLCNPLCTLFYALTSWKFFNSRIPYEEHTLRQFYKAEYESYSKRTIIGIPFIHSEAGAGVTKNHENNA